MALIVAISTLFFAFLTIYLGSCDYTGLVISVIFWYGLNWLLSAASLSRIFQLAPADEAQYPLLHAIVERLCQKAGVRKPKMMVSVINTPNAFAFVSPFFRATIAVTTGLLERLNDEEIEAVVAHELGHLKHRDVLLMMTAAFFPMLLYIIARGLLEGAAGADDEGALALFAIGLVGLLVYFLSELGVLALSRVREYYADRYSASLVDDGARKLSMALVKIVLSTRHGERKLAADGFKALLISDPDANVRDGLLLSPDTPDAALVKELKTRRMRARDWLGEALSSHPNITNRLRNLDAPPLESSPEWRGIIERWVASKQLLKDLSTGLKPPKEIVAIVEESMKRKAAVDRFILTLYNNAKAEMEKLKLQGGDLYKYQEEEI